jgi:hypothetical protein
MTFAQIPPGSAVFLDANSFIYHFTNDARYGAACTQLVNGWSSNSFPVSHRRPCWRMSPIA